ncbi:MAG: gliding motility protein GldN [Bacteroidetes bacterium]|nr:MAG: gliding motility protein GldN [Bacteroidota bacterium]
MLRNTLISCTLLLALGVTPIFAQKKKKGATTSAVPSKSAEQLKAEADAANQAKLDEENKKKAEAEAERQRKLAEYEAKIRRVISPDNFNKYSARPILDKDIMYRKMVWRFLDMKEKQNKGFMSVNHELPTLIMEYIKLGKLKPYKTDSLDDGLLLTDEQFKANTVDPNVQPPDTTGMAPDEKKEAMKSYANSAYLDPKLMTLMSLKEDAIFDRKRSRMYYDILALTIYIPASINPRGFNQPVASVKFKDLVELFRKDNRANWFNRENDAEHRNFIDAFDLRLFSSFIYKISNPNDEQIVDTYGGDLKKGRYGSEKAANDLMEFEHNLWEF